MLLLNFQVNSIRYSKQVYRVLTVQKQVCRGLAVQKSNLKIEPVSKAFSCQVLNHVTRVFLENEPLLSTFAPCTSGTRERELRKNVEKILSEDLSFMALDGNTVVGSALNLNVTRESVFSFDPREQFEDEALCYLESMCNQVHRELDLFTGLKVQCLFEVGWLSVEPSYGGKGIATQLVQRSLTLASKHCFPAAKADCTGPGSAIACKKCGMQEIHRLYYDDFKENGEVVFKNTPRRGTHLTVMMCQLQQPLQINHK